jgi:hypothetical protein
VPGTCVSRKAGIAAAGRGQAAASSGPGARLARRGVVDHAHLDGALTAAHEPPGFDARCCGALHAKVIGSHVRMLKKATSGIEPLCKALQASA